MTKEELVALGIPEDLATKAAEASKKELEGLVPRERLNEEASKKALEGLVPRERLNEEAAKTKAAKDALAERDGQLEDLKKSTGDAAALKKQIADLQNANKTADEKHAAELAALKVDSLVSSALITAKAKSVSAAKGELAAFLKDAKLDGESVKGLDDAIKALKEAEATKFLFAEDTPPKFKGLKPGEGEGGNPVTHAKTLQEAIAASMAKSQNTNT